MDPWIGGENPKRKPWLLTIGWGFLAVNCPIGSKSMKDLLQFFEIAHVFLFEGIRIYGGKVRKKK